MPNLKLKSKSEGCIARNAERQKNANSSQNTAQTKLFSFFTNPEEKQVDRIEVNNAINETTSKYFNAKEKREFGDLDESVSDFKPERPRRATQTKISDTNRSKESKTKNKKPKVSARTKTLNLQQYTKQFEEVCAVGGVDVNPEQLQLAIALSRSLSDFQGNSNISESTEPEQSSSTQDYLTEDDKIKKIRKTLDQYGFKVPVGPINLVPKIKRRRVDKNRANSSLLTRSIEEKKQIISSKVSQILFEFVQNISDSSNLRQAELKSDLLNQVWCKKSRLFNKSGLDFEDMIEFDVFYVNNLITPSDSKVGCLLKDWKSIPGRDSSPEREIPSRDFKESPLFPDYLHLLLSSTCAYLRKKIYIIRSPKKLFSPNKVREMDTRLIFNSSNSMSKECENNTVNQKSRSCSPEIFGDENYYEEDKNDLVTNNLHTSEPLPVEILNSSDDEDLPNVYLSQAKIEQNVSPAKNASTSLIKHLKSEELGFKDCEESIDLTQTNYISQKYFSHNSSKKYLSGEVILINETIDEENLNDESYTVAPGNKVHIASNEIEEMSSSYLKIKSTATNDTADIDELEKDARVNLKYSLDYPAIDSKTTPVKDIPSEISICENSGNPLKSLHLFDKKKISLGSFDDSAQFNELLKDFKSNQIKGDVSNNTVEDSIDLTQEDICSEDQNLDNILRNDRTFSEMYESQNGIVHYESYHEDIERLDISISDAPSQQCKNSISLSNSECSQKSKNMSSESIFEDSANHNKSLSKVYDDCDMEKENIDLTQQSNDSKVSLELKCLDSSSNAPQLVNETDRKSHKDSLSEVSCDVFVLSDEEFNYSISKSYKEKSFNKSRRKAKNCNEVSDSEPEFNFQGNDGHSSDQTDVFTALNNDYEKKKSDDLSNVIDLEDCVQSTDYRFSNKFVLYGSSFFDNIPSCNSSLTNVSNFNASKQQNVNGSKSKSQMVNTSSALNDFKNPELYLNETDELPNVYLTNGHNNISESGRKEPVINTLPNITNSNDSPASQIGRFNSNDEVFDVACTSESPDTNKYIIRTDNVSPVPKYDSMDTPSIQKELFKFGLKPFKRKRAVQLLEHIYNQTHPIINTNDLEMKLKRRKIEYNSTICKDKTLQNRSHPSPEKNKNRTISDNFNNSSSPEKCIKANSYSENNIVEGSSNIYIPDRSRIEIKTIECDPGDWIFQNREKTKVQGCRVPLHIAFHNYLSVRGKLRDAILRYDPVNIDIIHKGLSNDGYKYNAKDLFQFMDKKCITIKTTDKTGGTRYQKKPK